MSKLMYVTTRMVDPPQGGRAMLSRLHWHALSTLFGDRLTVHELDRAENGGGMAAALGGYLDGLTPATESAILDRLAAEGIDRLYIDGSNFGRLAQAVRKRLPRVQIFTFFHNVEARFFLGAVRQTKSVRAIGVLLANYLAERKAVRASHRLITLSRRDSRLLSRIYRRSGTDVLPMAMEDKLPAAPKSTERGQGQDRGGYALFVGGAFYANVAGILWFAREVAPHVALPTLVVGRGLEAFKDELERFPNVRVIGPVDDLARLYLDAAVVIAPIFDGSGMKTKVAEALMFGKRIVGTPEAFSGYEDIVDEAGWMCRTEAEFIAAIRHLEIDQPPRFDATLRARYESGYSREAATARLFRILERRGETCAGEC